MKPRYILVALIFGSTAFNAASQNLSTEIIVNRNIAPAERTTPRPSSVTPVVVLPDTAIVELTTDIYTEITPVDRSYSPLSPAPGAFVAEKTPYRGYISGGYFPALDFGVSAGYRILEKEKLSIGAKLQFDSERYRPYGEEGMQGVQYFVTGKIGLDLAWRPFAKSDLKAFVGYDFLREKTTYWNPQSVNSGNMGLSWKSVAGKLNYHAEINFDFEKISQTDKYLISLDETPVLPGLSQRYTRFCVGGDLPVVNETSRAGLDISGAFVNTSDNDYMQAEGPGKGTVGAFDITPYYHYAAKKISARIGVKFDFAIGGNNRKMNVMPDIKLAWTPSAVFGVWADIKGGSVMNPFSSLRQVTVYQTFMHPFDRSRIPVALEAGFNVGPFRGFYFGAFGGYAVANHWLMANSSVFDSFTSLNVKGWHAGIKIGGEWRFVKAELSADFAPSGYKNAWYCRRDRAGSVIDASVELNPIKPLTIDIDYQFRNRRKAYINNTVYNSLGCVSDLSAGATWRFTPAFSVFGRVENILGRRYMIVAWEPSRKVHGLVGVSYKF